MRLLKLKVRNIASLQGEHVINFQEIQKYSSLFAITGETGSGKSTILNSLGLALYGQLYKKNLGQLDVVTLGEKDGSIEVIFQVREKYYLADWRARVRKQNGEPYSTPQSPVRLLYKIDGPEFSDQKTVTTETAEQLLNLDFDQFCKCIILNQGEFARFLQASFTERKEILEKLYPGEVLESMGKELALSIDALKREKAEIEIKLGELENGSFSGELFEEQKKTLEAELIISESLCKKIETADFHFTSLFSYFTKYKEKELSNISLKKELASETSRFNLLIKETEEFQQQFETLSKKIETQRPLLQALLIKEERRKTIKQNDLNLEQQEQTLKGQLAQENEKVQSLNSEKLKYDIEITKLTSSFTFPLEDLRKDKDLLIESFDLFSELALLNEELKGKQERLKDIESTGKELKQKVTQLEEQLKTDPSELESQKKSIESRLADLQNNLNKHNEIKTFLIKSRSEHEALNEKIKILDLLIKKTEEEILPFESTLKMQELLTASMVCVTHALNNNSESCPVCEQKTTSSKWADLHARLSKTDLTVIKKKFDEGQNIVLKSKREFDFFQEKSSELNSQILLKHQELEQIILEPETENTLKGQLESINKNLWENDQLSKELRQKNAELLRSRDIYTRLKKESVDTEALVKSKSTALENLKEKSDLLKNLSKDQVRDLKHELNHLQTLNDFTHKSSQLQQSLTFSNDTILRLKKNFEETIQARKALQDEIKSLEQELYDGLKGQTASELIRRLDQELSQLNNDKSKKLEAQKNQESVLKNLQGRLSQLEELMKELDLHFTKELHTVRDFQYERLTQLDLSFETNPEMFETLDKYIKEEKHRLKDLVNTTRANLASVTTRLSEWEKLQDKIKILNVKAMDINEVLNRKLRLYEVLGKDELRTFVLSLVEENLIHQTNEELQKLCQGRYEIIHQTKSLRMTPEFFILDKFREGGRRKISTLSGGETFMVSLAMALGLAEMTRGQAEIDSLFIDEGFGTLDQDSLDDVLDMLKQIQTRGLMVGVISHIKALTSSIAVNLVLTKSRDGSSQMALRLN